MKIAQNMEKAVRGTAIKTKYKFFSKEAAFNLRIYLGSNACCMLCFLEDDKNHKPLAFLSP